MFHPEQMLEFFSETWEVWLVFTIVALLGYYFWWYLTQQRAYRVIDGKLQVRHGKLGRWEDLGGHLKEHGIDPN